MLDLVDEALDQMPLFVEMSIIRNCARPVGIGGDHGHHVALGHMRAKTVRIERFVAKDVLPGQISDQGLGLGRFVHLASGVEQTQHIAEGIDSNVNFRAQPSPRTPDRLFLNPPFPPAACWCARMIVPSMMMASKSGSSASAANMRSHTPALAHRRKRCHTLFHTPKKGGISRHGAPFRAIHTIASTNSRLLSPVRPGSPGLPGINGAIRSHCSSVNRWRIIHGLLYSEALNHKPNSGGIP